jgi:uncharacterized protein VirK/YbjX
LGALSMLRSVHALQSGAKDRLLLLGGSLRHPRSTFRWLDFVASDAALAGLVQSCPRMGVKIYRPYLSGCLGCSGRADALIVHYRHLMRAGLFGLMSQCATAPLSLARFSGKSGCVFELDLYGGRLEIREGELFLRLAMDGIVLYRIAFTLMEQDGVIVLRIGCLQGLRADDGVDAVRTATRELHACRPKNFLIAVARDIADYFGCRAVIGVCNHNLVAPSARRLAHAGTDYDQTWEELGATRREDRDYRLPSAAILRTTYDDLPSKKRSEARKRMALMQSTFDLVRFALELHRSMPAAEPSEERGDQASMRTRRSLPKTSS